MQIFFYWQQRGSASLCKKNYWITRQCWQLFEDWLFVTETVRLLFTRGHVWYPIQSTEKCPFILPYSWFPLGQGRNNKIAYSLNLQTSSLLQSVWCFISKQCAYEFFSWKHLRKIGITLNKDFLRMRLTRRCLNLGKLFREYHMIPLSY